MISMPILSFLIILPIVAVMVILTIRGDNELIAKNVRYISILTAVMHIILIIYLWFSFSKIDNTYQFIEKIILVGSIDFNYYVGVDGISLLFITFSSLLFLLIFTFIDFPIDNARLYSVSLLLVLSCATGTFIALDLVLFYIFYESSMIPVFFILGLFGSGNKLYSTFKFMLYTIFGSMLMIIAIIIMISLTKSSSIQAFQTFTFDYSVQLYLFIAIFIGLAIKSALFPFHSWLADVYDTAPISLNIILSGVLLKYGVYGMLRILLPIFPLAIIDLSIILYTLSFITLCYTGIIAFAETNIKRLFAYFSISHMALIVAGIFSFNTQGIEGAIFQSISHSIYNGGIFLSIFYLRKRFNSSKLEYFSGIANNMPLFCIALIVFGLAAMGLPGTNGFIGEFLTLIGIFQNHRFFALLFVFAILINATVVLRFNRDVIFGNSSSYTTSFKDVGLLEFFGLYSMVVFIIFMGIYPDVFLDVIHSSVAQLIENFKNGLIIRNDV